MQEGHRMSKKCETIDIVLHSMNLVDKVTAENSGECGILNVI
jgi:hypothetical protein